jgi:hypothetical protein
VYRITVAEPDGTKQDDDFLTVDHRGHSGLVDDIHQYSRERDDDVAGRDSGPCGQPGPRRYARTG